MILVVGGSGEIGSEILRQCEQLGWAAAGTQHRGDSGWIVDLDRPESSWRLPDRIGTAILAAGVSGFRECEKNPAATRRVNVLGIRRLAAALVARGATLTSLSSSAVFSGTESAPNENAPVAPTTEYGRQKAEIEACLRKGHPDSRIVRLTKVVSVRTPILQKWLRAWKAGETIDAYDNLYVSPISVQAAAQAALHSALSPSPGIFHLSASDALSYFEIARWLADQLGIPETQVRPAPAPHPNRPENALLGMTHFTAGTGFPRKTAGTHLLEAMGPLRNSAA